jgi:hypothetical protein
MKIQQSATLKKNRVAQMPECATRSAGCQKPKGALLSRNHQAALFTSLRNWRDMI